MRRFLLTFSAVFVAAGLTHAACTLAHAQLDNPPPLSLDRVSLAAGLEVQTYDKEAAELTSGPVAVSVPWAVAYSTGRVFSLGIGAHHDFSNDLNIYEYGIRALVAGTGQGDGVQLALGVNGCSYTGDWADNVPEKASWNAGLYGSYNLAGDTSDALRWYVSGSTTYDTQNALTTLRLGVRTVFSTWH